MVAADTIKTMKTKAPSRRIEKYLCTMGRKLRTEVPATTVIVTGARKHQ
jgi:hypothetical protein